MIFNINTRYVIFIFTLSPSSLLIFFPLIIAQLKPSRGSANSLIASFNWAAMKRLANIQSGQSMADLSVS